MASLVFCDSQIQNSAPTSVSKRSACQIFSACSQKLRNQVILNLTAAAFRASLFSSLVNRRRPWVRKPTVNFHPGLSFSIIIGSPSKVVFRLQLHWGRIPKFATFSAEKALTVLKQSNYRLDWGVGWLFSLSYVHSVGWEARKVWFTPININANQFPGRRTMSLQNHDFEKQKRRTADFL